MTHFPWRDPVNVNPEVQKYNLSTEHRGLIQNYMSSASQYNKFWDLEKSPHVQEETNMNKTVNSPLKEHFKNHSRQSQNFDNSINYDETIKRIKIKNISRKQISLVEEISEINSRWKSNKTNRIKDCNPQLRKSHDIQNTTNKTFGNNKDSIKLNDNSQIIKKDNNSK